MKRAAILLCLLSACSHAKTFSPELRLRALESREIAEEKAQPYFQFDWQDRSIRVAHGRWKIPEAHPGWNRAYGWGPVVWVSQGKITRVLDLRQEFPTFYVAHVFQDEVRGRIFLFLDYGIEGPAPVFRVWISEDRGEHWFQGADLQRPPDSFPPAFLDNFVLDANGEGTVWFRLEVSNLPIQNRAGMPLGADVFYLAHTHNGGHSWETSLRPVFSNLVHQEEEKHH